jgi:hypothetical protein
MEMKVFPFRAYKEYINLYVLLFSRQDVTNNKNDIIKWEMEQSQKQVYI